MSKYKTGETVKFIERVYTVKSSKKTHKMYGCPVYKIESLLPDPMGDFLTYNDVPETLLK